MSLVKYTTPPITFTHVDTRGNTASRKGHDLERGKVRLAEHVDLEVLAPWQVLDEIGRRVDELLKLGAELFVDDSGETCQADKPSNLGGKISPSDNPPSHSARPP